VQQVVQTAASRSPTARCGPVVQQIRTQRAEVMEFEFYITETLNSRESIGRTRITAVCRRFANQQRARKSYSKFRRVIETNSA